MSKFYSKSEAAFYDSDIHGQAMPADAVAVSDAQWSALLAAQAGGQAIAADANGNPIAVARVPTAAQTQVANQQQAQILLADADKTMHRVVEGVALGKCAFTNADVVAFVTYRQALRPIASTGVVPAGGWPAKPAYPVGT